MKHFLGIKVKQVENGVSISQTKYASDILERLNMLKCKYEATIVASGTKL